MYLTWLSSASASGFAVIVIDRGGPQPFVNVCGTAFAKYPLLSAWM